MTESMSGIHQGFVAALVRSQIYDRKSILEKIENDKIGSTYINACLK